MDLEDVLESVSSRFHGIVDSIPWPSAVEPLVISAGQAFRRLTDIATGASKERMPTPHVLNVASRMLSRALTSDWFPIRVPGVRLRDVALSRAIIVIALAPLIWTSLARLEFKTRALSRVLGQRMGAYALAVWIFCFSLYRDLLFVEAVVRQPQSAYFAQPAIVAAGALMVGIGTILVVSSMYALGIHGTYLGDYFGILMDAKVETFPFDMFDHPMYTGSTMCFFGKAILDESPAGILLSCWIYIVYQVTSAFEGPFTAQIYAARSGQRLGEHEKKA